MSFALGDRRERQAEWTTASRETGWRGDSAPVGLLLLLVGLLILLAVFLPTSDAVEKAKQAAKNERADSRQLPVVSVATEP